MAFSPPPQLVFSLSQTKFGMRVKAEAGDKTQMDRIFSNVTSVPEDVDEVLEDIGEYMRTSFEENFEARGRPAWEPLSSAYREARLAQGLGDTILEITGSLRAEVTEETASGHVHEIIKSGKTTTLIEGGSSDLFRIHQLGASGSRGPVSAIDAQALRWWSPTGEIIFAKSVGPASFTIPARPMVSLQPEDREEITRIMREWIYERLGR